MQALMNNKNHHYKELFYGPFNGAIAPLNNQLLIVCVLNKEGKGRERKGNKSYEG